MSLPYKFNSINSRYNNTSLYEIDLDSTDPKRGQIIFYGTVIFSDIPISENDFYIIVKTENIGRLDLLADQYYGNYEFWWIIALANNISDPFDDSIIGKNLRIPSLSTISTILGIAG